MTITDKITDTMTDKAKDKMKDTIKDETHIDSITGKQNQQPKESYYSLLVKDFAAGGVSGTVAKTVTAPVERVKLVLQTQEANGQVVSGKVPRYTGIRNTFMRLHNEQGLASLWRGNFTSCIRYFPTQAINLASKDYFRSMMPKNGPQLGFWRFMVANMMSGGLAGAFSLAFVYPLDYARTRLAADVGSGKRHFHGLWDCLVKTSEGPNGFLSLYKGFGTSVAGVIPLKGLQFGLNDTLKGMSPWDKDTSPTGMMYKWAIAQSSIITAAYATYPLDTVRRHLQMEADVPDEKRIYKGAVDCFNKIMKCEGWYGLFKGAGANVVRSFSGAVVLVLYGEM
ncbi:mitochondrial carrier domain-containing protein [Chytriomyces cf. hyalinus JEL632]|nr:mitochondrial carrier domain-containing protein [Chytriomyces cf. hyalinus JEL632]